MDVFEATRRRRSVRAFTGAPIPRADLEAIVDAGRLAASGHNRQPWTFVVITDPAMIARLALADRWMERAAAIVAVVLDPAAPYWVEDGSAAVENMLLAATALGYGSCWLEGDTRPHEATFKAWLGIPEALRLFTLVPVGVPATWPTVKKKPLEAVLRWERYAEAEEENPTHE
ncbi:MAG TPA: nitroreductase family protein [Anaerolineae bacterium]|nr:nitroreductase family protein [Anaerolineae bacterium]